MPVLSNPKYELFAQERAKGTTRIKAHETAGYKPDDGNAAKLEARKEVQARILEITGRGAERAEISVARVLSELGKLGFANMDDFVTVGQDGLPFVDFSNLTRDQKAAIQEITVETRTEMSVGEDGKKEATPVRRVRFKLTDKRAALCDIGRHLGMFIDRHEHGGIGDFERMADEEIFEEIQRMQQEASVPMSDTEH